MNEWATALAVGLPLLALGIGLFLWRFPRLVPPPHEPRRCTGACYGGHLGSPEQCAFLEGHDGECEP